MDLRIVRKQSRGRELAEAAHEWLLRSRRKLATAFMFIVALLLGVHVVFGSNGWAAYQKKKQENRQLQQEIQRLQKENEDLEQHVKSLRSDPKAIEKEAREQLHYARPGEVIYVAPEQKPAPTSSTGVAQKQGKQ